jgi:hypothetical protein
MSFALDDGTVQDVINMGVSIMNIHDDRLVPIDMTVVGLNILMSIIRGVVHSQYHICTRQTVQLGHVFPQAV